MAQALAPQALEGLPSRSLWAYLQVARHNGREGRTLRKASPAGNSNGCRLAFDLERRAEGLRRFSDALENVACTCTCCWCGQTARLQKLIRGVFVVHFGLPLADDIQHDGAERD